MCSGTHATRIHVHSSPDIHPAITNTPSTYLTNQSTSIPTNLPTYLPWHGFHGTDKQVCLKATNSMTICTQQ